VQVGSAVLDAVETIVKRQEGHKGCVAHSCMLRLFDLTSTVVQNEANNKMSAKNMAIVICPNLYSINGEKPMVALTMAGKVADFCTVLVYGEIRIRVRMRRE